MARLLSIILPLLFIAQTSGNTIAIRDTTFGDKQCGTAMCVTATVNGSNVEYVLSSTRKTVGWMAIGFGEQMANTPMVIMWSNPDGTVTLSQRTAPGEVMPTIDSNPPRVASLSDHSTSTSGSTPSFGFTIPANEDTHQTLIYAFSGTRPSSSALGAALVKHSDIGTLRLDLTKSSSTGSGGSSGGSSPSQDVPLRPYQRLIVAHAIFCAVGFLLFLPVGALLARYLRTFTPTWFTGHWIAQFGIAGPTIIIGVALGIQSVSQRSGSHLSDGHKKFGIVLFVLYFVQCTLGAVIHWVKPKKSTRRPPQNYIHAVLGLLIIVFAMGQVYSGYHTEWPKIAGRGSLPYAVSVVYFVWIIFIIVLYLVGLFLLKKQFMQEKGNGRRNVPSRYRDLSAYDLDSRDRR